MKIIILIGIIILLATPSVSAYTFEKYNIIGGTIEIDSCYGEGIGSYHCLRLGDKVIVLFDFYRPFFRFTGFSNFKWVNINSSDIGFFLDFKGFSFLKGGIDSFGGVVNIYGDNIFSGFIIKK